MSVVILQDDIVHYEVLGRGRPLIFLHGWVGSWRYWIPTMQAVSSTYRAYAIDLWGFGDSAKNPSKYSIKQQVALITDFMDQMGMAKTALIGHGLGAVVAVEFASQNPSLVDRVLAASYPFRNDTIHARLRNSSPGDLADWLLLRLPQNEQARAEAPKADQGAILASFMSIEDIDLLHAPFRTQPACLFVHCQGDPAVLPPRDEDLLALPEQAHLITFDGTTHFPMLDDPARFNRLLADFLALPSGESPRQLQLKEEWKRRIR